MIVFLETPEKRQKTRIKLYRDDVFLIAHETIKKQNLALPIEVLFASSDQFANFLLENDLDDHDLMQYEIDELRTEVKDELTFHLLLALSFVKLCALRKVKPNAESVARALVGFCQEYGGFTDLLKQLSKKEQERWYENKRADLLTYELKCIEKDVHAEDSNTIVTDIVEMAFGLTPEGMQHVENILSEINDKYGHRFQKQLDRLREARKKKSTFNINIEKMNDIHGNGNVNIASN